MTRQMVVNNGKREPRGRKDGRCTQCKGARPEIAVRDGDPFCKSACCRLYFGIPLRKEARLAC